SSHWRPEATGIAEVTTDSGGDLSGHLVGATATCESPRLEGKLSIPLLSTLPNPALRMQFAGTSGRTLRVSILYGTLWYNQSLTGVGESTWTTQYVCLPADFQGHVLGLEFESPHPGTCLTALYREFWLDDLVIVSESSVCP
ncbi:MAG: hypothetical protein JRG91_19020, partial [Deltaproteobacteria bacterium]|nr:hypothetical protein [Deltaproteobacteria bacterium]